MINYLVSCDDSDLKLGRYFNECEQNLCDFLSENNKLVNDYHRIPIGQNNEAYIDLIVTRYEQNPFLFIAYTHGKDDAIVCNRTDIVNIGNSDRFNNAFFYSIACSAARRLGPELIAKGCLAFVGYREPSIAFTDESYRAMSIACENYGLKLWLLDDIEIHQAVASMKQYFTKKIEQLYANGDIMLAGNMVSNREALICLGDSTLKRNALFVKSNSKTTIPQHITTRYDKML